MMTSCRIAYRAINISSDANRISDAARNVISQRTTLNALRKGRERKRERGRKRRKLCRASKKFSDQVRARVINALNVEFQKDAVEASRNHTKRGTRAPFLFPRAERPRCEFAACRDDISDAIREKTRGNDFAVQGERVVSVAELARARRSRISESLAIDSETSEGPEGRGRGKRVRSECRCDE